MRTAFSSKHLLFFGLLVCALGGALAISHDYDTQRLRLVSGQAQVAAALPLLGTPLPMAAYLPYPSCPSSPATASNVKPVGEDAENRVNWLRMITEHVLRTLRFSVGGTAR